MFCLSFFKNIFLELALYRIMKQICFFIFLLALQLFGMAARAQSIDIGAIGKGKAFKISGGVNGNSIFYHSQDNASRAPFTYFLQGNLNLSFYQFSMPISYSYSNQGSQLDYDLPYDFNRLSLHPKYKWILGHIGDVSMTFSPYTLSGHQFTGLGLELTPPNGIDVRAMGGRLLRATPDDGLEPSVPAFERMGYGAQVAVNRNKFGVHAIAFYAVDDLASIPEVPEEKGVLPQENLVVSLGGHVLLFEDIKLDAEYASSALTLDTRAVAASGGEGIASVFFNHTAATEYYHAVKASLSYVFAKNTLGVAYERIDPGYETLGAYYFNNDFENITLNGTSLLFADQVNLSFNVGYQQDDLNNQKESATNRTVGSVNVNISATERLNITTSYSNFTTFTNVKVDQFELINANDPVDVVTDQFNYSQLSQNANVNVNYVIAQDEKSQQMTSLNYALADVTNTQDEQVGIGGASTFHNFNGSYLLGFPRMSLNFNAGLNLTYHTIGDQEATTWGPVLGVNKKFFDNQLNAALSGTYSQSTSSDTNTKILNVRAALSYNLWVKHNFNLNAVASFRNTALDNTQELTVNFAYAYRF